MKNDQILVWFMFFLSTYTSEAVMERSDLKTENKEDITCICSSGIIQTNAFDNMAKCNLPD